MMHLASLLWIISFSLTKNLCKKPSEDCIELKNGDVHSLRIFANKQTCVVVILTMNPLLCLSDKLVIWYIVVKLLPMCIFRLLV